MAERILFVAEVDAAGAITELKKLEDQVGDKLPQASSKASTGLGMIKTAIGALGLAALGREALQLGGSIIRTGAEFESLGVQLRAVTGSSSAAQGAMAWITNFAQTTPLQMQQVTDTFIKLKSMGLDPMDGTMQAVTDAAMFMGTGFEGVQRISLALGQSWAKGKLQGEELRQLMEANVPAADLLAQAYGTTAGEILEMASKGKLGKDAIKDLISAMGTMYGGASIAQMDTFTGKWSNLQDQISLAMNELAQHGALDAVKAAMAALSNEITKLASSGAITRVAESMGRFLGDTARGIPAAIDLVKDLAQGFISLGEKIGEVVGWMTGAKGIIWALEEIGIKGRDAGMTLRSEFNQQDKFEAFARAIGDMGLKVSDLSRVLGVEGVPALYEAVNATAAARGEGGTYNAILDRMNQILREDTTPQFAAMTSAVTTAATAIAKPGTGLSPVTQAAAVAAAEAKANYEAFRSKLEQLGAAVGQAQMDQLTEDVIGAREEAEDAWTAFDELREAVLGVPTNIQFNEEQFRQSVENLVSIWDDAAAQMSQSLGYAISDALVAVFSGDYESITDIWEDLVGEWQRTFADALVETFKTAFSQGGGGWQAFMAQGGGGQLLQAGGMMIGGYLQAQGQQTGSRRTSVLGGMISGAAMGLSTGTGWIGAVVGAIVGGVMAYFGSQSDVPETKYSIGPEGATIDTRGHQGYGTEKREAWKRRVESLYRSYMTGYREVLQLFESADLFEGLSDQLPRYAQEWAQGTAEDFLKIISDVVMPDIMQTYWGEAITQGLRQSGVSRGAIAELWQELGNLPGTERVQALSDFVSAVVNLGKLTEALDWSNLRDIASEGSMAAYQRSFGSMQGAIENLFLGMDQMDLIDRARQAQEIEQLIDQARQQEIQYLAQIMQMQSQMNLAIDKQIEQLRLGGMSPLEQRSYAWGQIQELYAGIGTAASPEELQQLMARLQEMVTLYAGTLSEEGLYMASPTGGPSVADWLIGLLEDARDLANARFGDFQDEIQTTNDYLIEQLERLAEALGTVADRIYGDYVGDGTVRPVSDYEHQQGGGVGRDEINDYLGASIEHLSGGIDGLSGSIAALAAAIGSMSPPQVHVSVQGSLAGIASVVSSVMAANAAANTQNY